MSKNDILLLRRIIMYLKRFIQLFIMFLVAIFLSLFIVSLFNIRGFIAQAAALTIIGYVFLTIPLTVLTILKQRKKFKRNIVDTTDLFQNAWANLENIIVLSTYGNGTTSIVTVKQSHDKINGFYVVTDSKSKRIEDIREHANVCFSTWYHRETGIRISSNNVHAEIILPFNLKAEIQQHPEIKELSDNFHDKVVVKLTVLSALIESFQINPTVVTFD